MRSWILTGAVLNLGVGSIPIAAALEDSAVVALSGDIEERNTLDTSTNMRNALKSMSGAGECVQW